jgi:hypothetical protein
LPPNGTPLFGIFVAVLVVAAASMGPLAFGWMSASQPLEIPFHAFRWIAYGFFALMASIVCAFGGVVVAIIIGCLTGADE